MASQDSSNLTYFRKLRRGTTDYGPVTITDSTFKHEEASIENYEYCHQENTSSREFSMTNEVSVSGVVKAFDIGATHSNTFAHISTEAERTGNEIKSFQKQFVQVSEKKERTIKEGQFLAFYSAVKVCCFTVNRGKRQYSYIPASDVFVKPMFPKDIRSLIDEGLHYVDSQSWSSVGHQDMKFDDISELLKTLKPLNIEVPIPYGTYKIKTTKHDPSGMVAGWGLASWMDHGAKRNDSSSWVAVHQGEKWPCRWEIMPGKEEGTFRIETHTHVAGRQPAGFGLSAFRFGIGNRNSGSTRVAAHNGTRWPMDWKIVPGKKINTWRINTTDHWDSGHCAGWGLGAWGRKVGDTVRNDSSSWVHVHEGDYWPMDWVLEKQD